MHNVVRVCRALLRSFRTAGRRMLAVGLLALGGAQLLVGASAAPATLHTAPGAKVACITGWCTARPVSGRAGPGLPAAARLVSLLQPTLGHPPPCTSSTSS
jgi:hypothetical protein